MKLLTLGASTLLLLSCAADPWAKYQAAQTCYFNQKADCKPLYTETIEIKNDLPGVHSSFGTWLLRSGKETEANAEFAKELELHPYAKVAVNLATQSKSTSTEGAK
jgi:hypothetical protein